MTRVLEFLKSASERGKAPGSSAYIVDFGSIQNIDDPTIAQALIEHFEHAVAEAGTATSRLTTREVACLCPDSSMARIIGAADELDRLISERGLGAVRWTRYVLPRDARALSDRIGAIVGTQDRSRSEARRQDRLSDLAQLLGMEQMLRQADISSMIHHQAIYDFTKPRSPVTLARELTVSLDRLADSLGIALSDNPWLFDKATLLLDRRMLSHIVHDRSRHDSPFAINLRVATVLDPVFPDLIGRLAASDHDTLIVELSERDRTSDAAAFDAAVRELDRLGIHIAYHAGGWDGLSVLASATEDSDGRFLRHIDLVKVRWDTTDLDLTAGEIGKISALVQDIRPHRVVLERVENEAAIDFALGIGVHLIQGFGATEYAQARQAKDRARAASMTSRAARKAAEAAEKPQRVESTLRKMLRF